MQPLLAPTGDKSTWSAGGSRLRRTDAEEDPHVEDKPTRKNQTSRIKLVDKDCDGHSLLFGIRFRKCSFRGHRDSTLPSALPNIRRPAVVAFLSLAAVAVRKKDDSISTTIEAMTTLI
jgi:hypothetical protein